MPLISVVIPVYNEEETLPQLFLRLSSISAEGGDNCDYEFIFVDDGSSDSSLKIISEKVRTDASFKILCLSRNFGHQAALLAGITHALGDAVIVMDADLQDPPEVIPRLVSAWLDGSDVVYAQRAERQGENWFKRRSAEVFYWLINWFSETDLPRNVGDFRIMDREVVDQIKGLPERSLYLRGLVAWIGFRQTAVVYDRDPRFAGDTKYSLKKMLSLATDALLSFSEKPLRFVTQIGLTVTSLAFGTLAFFIATIPFGTHHLVPGWFSIITAILLLGGVQLICLGIVGAYVSRIYREAKGRPIYIINKKKSL
jgi:glycosyltransferase involved in cell wall biosynthesis